MSLGMSKSKGDERSPEETEQCAQKALMRLLATPPEPKSKPKADASQKKRGRPPKAAEGESEGPCAAIVSRVLAANRKVRRKAV